MSENNAKKFFQSSASANTSTVKWGLTAGGVSVADFSVTWGLQGKVNYGMSTSFYFAPTALGLTAVSPFVPLWCMPMMISQSELMYKGFARAAAGLYGFFGGLPTQLGERSGVRAALMNFPAYATIEAGAKCDTVIGNKYDFCAGAVNKMINGETVYCMADKVEWYEADCYKFIKGTETKMEAKKLGSQSVGGKTNITQNEVLADKNSYAANYKIHSDYLKAQAKHDSDQAALGNMTVTCGKTHKIETETAVLVATKSVNHVGKTSMTLKAGNTMAISSESGTVKLCAGSNPGVSISAAETKIANKLTLGMPGGQAPVIVQDALASYNAALASLQKDMATAEECMQELYIKAYLG